MIRWALIFAVISLIAGIFGFTDVSHGAASIAKFLFAIALALFLVFLLLGLFVAKKVTS